MLIIKMVNIFHLEKVLWNKRVLVLKFQIKIHIYIYMKNYNKICKLRKNNIMNLFLKNKQEIMKFKN